MKDRLWQDVPGAPGARIFPLIRKPDVVCSNSYIITVPGQLIVIDPGADPVQMGEIMEQLRSLPRTGQEHVCFYLTHCHVDHCFVLMKGAGGAVLDGAVMLAHPDGVKALTEFDAEVTQAHIMGWDFPPVELQVKLHALLSGDGSEAGQLAQPTSMCEMRTVEGLSIGYQRIPLGNGLEMSVYHTPGHSPDSVCYQMGRLLFTGDLLFATDSGLVGIIGWDRDAMESSIRNVSWLLEEQPIEECLPGHGHCLEVSKVRPMLERMLKDVRGLGKVRTKDAERIMFTSNYALDLLDEANDNFSIIAGRLYYLAYNLENLEEGSQARKYLDILEHDRIDEMLTSFNRFVEEFHAGKKLQLQVTMKAVQTMKSISNIFKGSELEAVLDRSLVSGTSRLLTDFMNAVKGIDLEVERKALELCSLVGEVLDDQRTRPSDDLMECLDDPERYASALARRIAHIPIFDDIEMTLEGGSAEVLLDHRRFQDALSGTLMDLAGADAGVLALAIEGTTLRIRTDIPSASMGEKKVRALTRRFELAGAILRMEEGTLWQCTIACDPA